MPGPDFRMSVLHVDRGTDLPLTYTYEPDVRSFRALGYVRMHGLMIVPEPFPGQDTPADRDRFLTSVLAALGVPSDRAAAIVRTADHLDDAGGSGVPRDHQDVRDRPDPRAPHDPVAARRAYERLGLADRIDGSFLAGRGVIAGLALGAVLGWLLAGADGAVIGAFVVGSTLPDLLVAAYQIRTHDRIDSGIDPHDSWAMVLVAGGAVGGALVGALVGGEGVIRAASVFVAMAAVAFVLSLVATGFSMVAWRARTMTWLGPLVVGACVGLAHLVWDHPVSVALGVVVGSLVARVPARAVTATADGGAR